MGGARTTSGRTRWRRSVVGAAVAGALAVVAAGAGVAAAPPAQAAPDTRVISDMQWGHDNERASRQLDPLHRDSRMDGVAQAWADRLASDNSSLRHSTADPAYDYSSHIPRGFRGAGENVGQHWNSGGDLVWMWMNSQGHRDNILNPAFDSVGYGAARSGDGKLWAVVVFADYYSGPWPGAPSPTATPSSTPLPTTPTTPTASPTAAPATSSPTATATPAVPTRPVSGEDRYATGVAVARVIAPSPTTAVVASGERLVDSVPAAPLARKLGGPLLLTTGAGLSPSVAAHLRATPSITRVVVVGGELAVTPQVVADLTALGLQVERVGGADRYATALAVAARPELAGSPTAYVARGSGTLADAVAVGGTAAALGAPVLLAPPTPGEVTAGAVAATKDRRVVVVGGTGAVSDDVARALAADERVQGADRYATAAAVADHAVGAGVATGRVLVASGDDARLADALVSGAAGSVTLLVRPSGWGAATTAWLTGHGVTEVLAVGGATPTR